MTPMSPLATLVAAAIAKLPGDAARTLRLIAAWPRIAGDTLRDRARPRVEGDVAVIEVADPRWAREVRALSGILRRRVREVVPELRDVTVAVVDELPAPPRREPPTVSPAPVASGDEHAPAAVARAMASIPDRELRARAVAIAAKYLEAGKRRRGET